jgi:hypothetical protein
MLNNRRAAGRSLGLRDRVGNGHCRNGLALAPVVVGCGDRDEFDRNHVTCGENGFKLR